MDTAGEQPFDAKVDELVELFKLLADPTRVKILILLAGGERNVTTLCNILKLPQPTVSHHLSLLRQFGLIANRRDGKQVFYQLDGRIDRNTEGVLGMDAGEYKLRITQPNGMLEIVQKN